MPEQPVAETVSSKPRVDFLWLELTNQCNLECVHCYAESGPKGEKGTISTAEYTELMTDAYALGCRRVQFIGGEPTLRKDLPELIRAASNMGFEFIEVYTNLTILPDELLQCFVAHGVHVATSVYGPVSKPHDAITLVDGSFERTTRNLRRVVKSGLPVRASIVEMEINAACTDSTVAFLHEMGVQNVGVDKIRQIGRGAPCESSKQMSELCGNCAGGTLCVSPTGVVSPCIMSKKWAVGSLSEASLSDIATGASLRETRHQIYDATISKRAGADCAPSLIARHAGCPPTYTAANRPVLASCTPEASNDSHPDCSPAYAAVARPIGADCSPALTAACHPTVTDRAACFPSVTQHAADCLPVYTVAGRPVFASCHPEASNDSHPDCSPTYAAVAKPMGTDCSPALTTACHPTVTDRAACFPAYTVAGRPVFASCIPQASNDSHPDCSPTYTAAGRPIGADCSPALASACHPTVIAHAPVCSPTYTAADRTIRTNCGPSINPLPIRS